MNCTGIKRRVRRFVRSLTKRDIVPYTPAHSQEARLIHILRWMHIDTVIDVGAGHGEFGRQIYSDGFRGVVISIEPSSVAHGDLTKVARSHPRWIVMERCAAGREDGEAVLHVTRRTGSSSLRRLCAEHTRTDKDSVEVEQEVVEVRRLDRLVGPLIAAENRVFLKIDVQGTEDDVLEGGGGLMGRVLGVQIELSVVELYEGQKLMAEMLSWAGQHGLVLWALDPVYVDAVTGRTLQYDAVFRCEHESTQ